MVNSQAVHNDKPSLLAIHTIYKEEEDHNKGHPAVQQVGRYFVQKPTIMSERIYDSMKIIKLVKVYMR